MNGQLQYKAVPCDCSVKIRLLVLLVFTTILQQGDVIVTQNVTATAINCKNSLYHRSSSINRSRRSRKSLQHTSATFLPDMDESTLFLNDQFPGTIDVQSDVETTILLVKRSIGYALVRGALLRIASDLSGGTPLETIKTRVTVTTDNMIKATQTIVTTGGIQALWTGTSSRTIEGAFVGAMFMLGSVLTKRQLIALGASSTTAALAGGLVGGVAQAIVMTPAGLIFTALNENQKNSGGNKSKKNSSKKTKAQNEESALQVVKRVVAERGLMGMYSGIQPMCIRQATNWASRAGFTEIARTTLQLQQYGIIGEVIAGVIGGVGSCWNTPIETIRVYIHRDVNQGLPIKSMSEYWTSIVDEAGYPGLFRGVTPRAIQAVWQTVFLVVVPNLMGI